jgi:hypothetical protein
MDISDIVDEKTAGMIKRYHAELLFRCFLHGHDDRDVPGLGRCCVRCGRPTPDTNKAGRPGRERGR